MVLIRLTPSGLLPWVKLIDNFDAEYEYVTNEGTVFTFKTNLEAPRYRLLNIDFSQPSMSSWKELIPQHDKDVLGKCVCVCLVLGVGVCGGGRKDTLGYRIKGY